MQGRAGPPENDGRVFFTAPTVWRLIYLNNREPTDNFTPRARRRDGISKLPTYFAEPRPLIHVDQSFTTNMVN